MTRARSGSAAKRGCKASKATRATYMKPKVVDKRLKPVEQKSLDTLRMLRDVLKVQNPCRRHLAYFSGYESHKQQGFEVVLRNNKKKGLVHFPDTETVQLTDAGYRVAGEMSDPPTSDEEFHQFLMAHITPAQGKVFTVRTPACSYPYCRALQLLSVQHIPFARLALSPTTPRSFLTGGFIRRRTW